MVKVEGSDEPRRGGEAEAWLSSSSRKPWQPNTDLAAETASFGFDQIQYDLLRCPSDSHLSTADFGLEYAEERRASAMVAFRETSRVAFEPLGLVSAVDI